MKTDAINVTLPNGIELVMFRKVKGLMSKGQEESVEELWGRFARALKPTAGPPLPNPRPLPTIRA